MNFQLFCLFRVLFTLYGILDFRAVGEKSSMRYLATERSSHRTEEDKEEAPPVCSHNPTQFAKRLLSLRNFLT